MIIRKAEEHFFHLLKEFPAVCILGPRQVGKTTLAQSLSERFQPEPVYLDLENPSDLAKLQEPEQYFHAHQDRLIILDEVQRTPEIFRILRGMIDRRRRGEDRAGHFLILGSASLDLLKQSSESLAGRIAYRELTVLTVEDIMESNARDKLRLWVRGGFPDSFLAADDEASMRWRTNFITTYLERDVPQLGSRIPAVTLRRFWTMLAHNQGDQLNAAKLAGSIDISAQSVKRYVELLEDLLLVRTLRPWSGNVKKRLVKTPKVYIRDSGLTHALLGLESLDDVLGHPVAGGSWEGFALENILSALPEGATPWYYRTSAGAELDLVIEISARRRIAIEIKRSTAPRASKGFHIAADDIHARQRYLVYPGDDRYPASGNVTVIPLQQLMAELKDGTF